MIEKILRRRAGFSQHSPSIIAGSVQSNCRPCAAHAARLAWPYVVAVLRLYQLLSTPSDRRPASDRRAGHARSLPEAVMPLRDFLFRDRIAGLPLEYVTIAAALAVLLIVGIFGWHLA